MNKRKYNEDVDRFVKQIAEFFQALQWSKSTKHRRKITAKFGDLQKYFEQMGDFTTYYALLGLTYEHIRFFPKLRARRILHKKLKSLGATFQMEDTDETK